MGIQGARGHIEARANGTYRAVVHAGKDPFTGRPRYLKRTAESEKQAKVALSKLLNQVDEQRHPKSNIVVRLVIAKWLEVTKHEGSTRERYLQLVRDYLEPRLGSMPAAKLDAELLEPCMPVWVGARARTVAASRKVRGGHECKPPTPRTRPSSRRPVLVKWHPERRGTGPEFVDSLEWP